MNIAQYIDATFLSVDVSEPEQEQRVRKLCKEVQQYNLRGICIRPQWVALCRTLLAETHCEIACVVAFPTTKSTIQEQKTNPIFGNIPTSQKTEQIQQAFESGATEVDVVLNTRFYRLNNEALKDAVFEEVRTLQKACEAHRLKLIIECDLLEPEQLPIVVEAALEAKIDCIKNATGYVADGQGATFELIESINEQIVGSTQPDTLIKASAGIKSPEQALQLIQAGADIIGTSSAKAILTPSTTSHVSATAY